MQPAEKERQFELTHYTSGAAQQILRIKDSGFFSLNSVPDIGL